MSKVLYTREDNDEGMLDLFDSLMDDFGNITKDLPKDEDGDFVRGTFKVTVEWTDEE